MKKIFVVFIVFLNMACLFARGTSSMDTMSAPYAWIEIIEEGKFPRVNPLRVTGNIVTAGSSTVAPLAAVIVERYKEDGFGEQITVDVIGSGAGFERFTVLGETDVAHASRAITDSEVSNANKINRTPIPFRVGTDALSVVVAKDNNFIMNASAEELAAIFGSAERWSDVNSSWPSEPILRYVPGTDSGTFDFFVELIYDKDPSEILSASNTQFSEDDNILVRGISNSIYAVGFLGYAYYFENKDSLNILSVESIDATLETAEKANADSISENVALGAYPLARPLFIYSDRNVMRSKPQVAAYIAYFINNVNYVIEEVGYFPADLEPAKQTWLEAMEGTY